MNHPQRLCLRLYKNRELVRSQDVQQQWASGRWWEEVCGTLHQATGKASVKYDKAYDAQELEFDDTDRSFQYTPTKACLLWRIDDGQIEQHNAKLYKTVQAHPPAPSLQVGENRFVQCSLASANHRVDTSTLPKTVWKQIGHSSGDILLLKLKKRLLSGDDVVIAKDDLTGDVYPYHIERVLYLTKKNEENTTVHQKWQKLWQHPITPDQFLLYRTHQKKGDFNMMELSTRYPHLFTYEEVVYIISHYEQLLTDSSTSVV